MPRKLCKSSLKSGFWKPLEASGSRAHLGELESESDREPRWETVTCKAAHLRVQTGSVLTSQVA